MRLPAAVVEAPGLKEGDEVDIRVAGERAFDVALARVRALRGPLPADWKFDRDEANAR